jgi:Aspartate amino-transferase
VQDVFRARLGGTGAGRWTEPRGGYFISLDVMEGCAKRGRHAGQRLRRGGGAGGSHLSVRPRSERYQPAYRPTFPPIEEVRQAAQALATCALLAATEKLLRDRGVND